MNSKDEVVTDKIQAELLHPLKCTCIGEGVFKQFEPVNNCGCVRRQEALKQYEELKTYEQDILSNLSSLILMLEREDEIGRITDELKLGLIGAIAVRNKRPRWLSEKEIR